jgi:putative membrane protein
MRRTLQLACVCLTAAALGAVSVAAQDAKQKGGAEGDQGFATKAAQINLGEIDAGMLAKKMSRRQDVQQFGDKLTLDHRKANEELKRIADKNGWTLPSMTDEKHKAVCERLGKLEGERFDQEFLQAMVTGHQEAIKLFETQASTGKNADLQGYAKNLLPGLRDHLKTAQELQAKGGKGAGR